MNLSLLNPKLGLKQTNHLDDKPHHDLHKIPSLPIFRKNLLNSSRLRQRIQIDGDKFFAKLSASGPETSKIIQGIRRSRNVKWIRKFEFDPYLCDHSHLNDLRQIAYKIRDISWLNLVVRRVNFPQELETIAPFVSRFSRLRSLRVEFPRTGYVDENGFIQLSKAIGNCVQLRSFEWKGIEMVSRSSRYNKVSHNALQCLKWLNNIKLCETSKKGALQNNVTESDKSDTPLKMRKTRRAITNKGRAVDLVFAFAGEWANKEMVDQDKQMEGMKMGAQMSTGLKKLRILMIKIPKNFEDIINFLTFVAFVPTLSHLEVQHLNCQISDMEVMAYAHGLQKAKQLKYFSLKVIQKPGLSEDCIEQLAGVLSKLDNLSKFDVYLRRLGLHPQGVKDLGNRIEKFGNIQSCCSKESIHLYRRSDNEESH